MAEVKVAAKLDVLGKRCPEPNIMIKDKLAALSPGDVLEVTGDAENRRSIERFVRSRGHEIVSITEEGAKFIMLLRKAEKERGDVPVSTCPAKRG
jgi:TusA-related sulfurtransferase